MLGPRPSGSSTSTRIDTHFFAYSYWKQGLSPIPVRLDGTKAPCYSGWDRYGHERPHDYELSNWFGQDDVGIGIACGGASGNLAVLDFEDAEAFEKWTLVIPDESREQFAGCPCIITPSGGAHVWVRLPEPVRGTVLARYADKGVKIEVRGLGHQVIAPGSHVDVHPTKKPYRFANTGRCWLQGVQPQPVTWDSWWSWCLAAESLTEYTPPAPPSAPRPSGPVGDPTDDQPGTDFNRRGSWAETGLFDAGWKWFRQYDPDRGLITRPGKEAGCSATIGVVQSSRNDWPLFHCFSASALPFEADASESRFGVFAKLKHRGDFSAAASALKKMGYGRKDVKVKITSVGSDGAEELNEDDDDPHRLARALVSSYRDAGRRTLVFWRGEFHEWNGCHYRTLAASDFKAEVTTRVWEDLKAIHRLRIEAQEDGNKGKPPRMPKVTRQLVGNVVGAMEGLCRLSGVEEAPAWIAGDGPDPRDLVATTGGLVHLRDFAEGRPHAVLGNTPHYFNFNSVGYSPEVAAPPPRHWLAFLDSVWPNDPSSIALLQEWFGYLLTLDNRQQKMLLMVGPRRSGKGTILSIIRALVGAGNCAGMTTGTLASQFGLSTLIGKSVGIFDDARLTVKVKDASIISERLLTISGCGEIPVDRKGVPILNTRLPVRFVVATNDVPDLPDASGALAGRWSVLPLTISFFGREDLGLLARLMTELPGVFNWSVEGWKRLRQQGRFTVSERASGHITAIEDTGSPISRFVQDVCVVDATGVVPRDRLFAEWKQWCLSEGERDFCNQNTFARHLRSAVPTIGDTRTRTSEGRIRFYTGIRLRCRVDDAKDFAEQTDTSEEEVWATRAG